MQREAKRRKTDAVVAEVRRFQQGVGYEEVVGFDDGVQGFIEGCVDGDFGVGGGGGKDVGEDESLAEDLGL